MEGKLIDNIVKKRMSLLYMVTLTIFSILIYRLYYIQIDQGDKLTSGVLKQRGEEFPISPNRGMIFDRYLNPITNNDTETILIVESDRLKKDVSLYKDVKRSMQISQESLNKLLLSEKRLLQLVLADKKVLSDRKDLFIIDRIRRYEQAYPLAHVIGYVNQAENKGSSGIELIYDEFLKTKSSSTFLIEYDRDRKIILGGSKFVNEDIKSNDPSGVKLTIDFLLQKKIEMIMDKLNYDGAVIVSEVESGEILSMVSRPNFNQNNIYESFENLNMAFYNKGIQVSYPPGSTFKTLVLLAALEENPKIVNETFYCQGFEEINGINISCTGIHGQISLEDAFAKSCNSTFIQIGEGLGAEKIIEMAKRFGFDSEVGIGLLGEIKGNLPKKEELHGAAIGNISIGQGELELTPMQIHNLMMIVTNEGLYKDMHIVQGITNNSGQIIKKYSKGESRQIISKESALIALDYLRKVAEVGTAKSINLHDIGSCGGKTGSAQAVLNHAKTIHGWFTGFYPSNKPKYVITILIEDVKSGSTATLPIFQEIAKEIYIQNINNQ